MNVKRFIRDFTFCLEQNEKHRVMTLVIVDCPGKIHLDVFVINRVRVKGTPSGFISKRMDWIPSTYVNLST